MAGIVIQLIVSWLLLKYMARQNLSALGIYPSKKMILDFLTGFTVPVIYFLILLFSIAALVHNPYRLNPNYSVKDFFTGTVYVLKAVVYEELIFRGALLYVLSRRIGMQKSILISATAFGIYHWFSWSVLGQPIQMLLVFINTGVLGYLWAALFVKKRSMVLPMALHLGANFASMIIFSRDKNIGLQLLTKTYLRDPVVPPAYISIPIIMLYVAGFHVLCFGIIKLSKPLIA